MALNTTNGLCECGCGERAPISRVNSTRKGWRKGEPKRFVNHHHRRVGSHGTITAYSHWDCRCSACCEAVAEYHRMLREQSLADYEAGLPMPYEHGTHQAYVIGLCRCEECRAANNETHKRQTERYRQDRLNDVPLPDGSEHGTLTAYKTLCCRCDECRAANARNARAWRARKAEGIPDPRDADQRVERVRLSLAAA